MGWGRGEGQRRTHEAGLCTHTLPSLPAPSVPCPRSYNIPDGGFGASAQSFTDYTAEFLLTRGPYALLGYSWFGCTDGDKQNPRAAEWDEEYGTPTDDHCYETSTPGVFTRAWTGANVVWDCNAQHGQINRT